MEKFYEFSLFTPTKYKPLARDPFTLNPRLIQPSEMKQKPQLPKNVVVKWNTYRTFHNGDIIYELDAPQRSLLWSYGRLGRMNSSKTGEIIGLSSYNKDLVSTSLEISGYVERKRTEKEKGFMDKGEKLEPLTKLHCEAYHQCTIKEVGYLVPSWKPYLGDSPDGEVTKIYDVNGEKKIYRMSAEFKNPIRMYRSLRERLQVIDEGGDVKENDFTHIKPEHYVQCHQHMYCMNTEYCIYHVTDFNEEEPLFFSQIIPFDPNFWNWCLQRMEIFYKYYLLPITRNTGFPLVPSSS